MKEIKFLLWDEENQILYDWQEVKKSLFLVVEKYECFQYIGKKDINNQEIYEGHLFKGILGHIFKIVWNNVKLCYALAEWINDKWLVIGDELYKLPIEKMEIIGHIKTHKELLINKYD